MDLFTIAQKMWRHKFVLAPIVALTLLGVVYVVALKAPVYQTTANYILLSPPPPPTAQELAADPSLGKISSNNPYMDFGDLSIVADLAAQIVTSEPVQADLAKQGANPAYTVAPSQQFGLTTPMLAITGVGATPEEAVHTATLVGQALVADLDKLQAAKGVNPHYYISASQFTAPNAPKMEVSSKLRALVGVLAVGMLLTFIVLSVADGIAERRTLGRTGASGAGAPAAPPPVPAAPVAYAPVPQARVATPPAPKASAATAAVAGASGGRDATKSRTGRPKRRPGGNTATPAHREAPTRAQTDSDRPADWYLQAVRAVSNAHERADTGS